MYPKVPFLPSRAIRYVVPAVAEKVTLLVVPPGMSSLLATRVSDPTLEPVYTASRVSIEGPRVSIVTGPARGACQRSHSECPPALPAWFGSPASLLAPVLSMSKLPLDPRSAIALANPSFSGTPGVGAGTVQVIDAGEG